MDIFMDKLAQRATAQEIIKANTAADVEELNRLKNQITEYNECLERLQGLVDEASSRLTDAGRRQWEGRALAQEGMEGIKALRKTVEGLGQCQKKVAEQLESMEKSAAVRVEDAARTLSEKLDGLNGLTEEQLTERLNAVEENVHKECVKVYRNVQAVVTEESGRQNEALAETKTSISDLKGRLGAIFGFSAAAMAVSLLSLLFQILAHLDVLPF